MSAYVYLLAHQSAARFKIGKAVDVGARVRQLGVNRFDYARSRALRVSDDAAANNLERLLHRAFAKSRLAPSAIVGMPGESTDGDSEWFSADCKARLDDFLEANQDLLDFEPVPHTDFTSMLPSARKPALPAPRSTVRRYAKPVEPPCQGIDVTGDVQVFLRKLSSFVSEASDLEFHPPKPGWDYGVLTGSLPLEGKFDPQALFAELMDCSVKTGRSGAFRLVSSVTFSQTGPAVEFEIDVLWSSHREAFQEHAKAAAQIAAFPLQVPGWSGKSLGVAE